MKILRFITVCAAVFLVAATAGFAQHVRTDFDHQANFGQYKTYSWKEIKPGASLWDSRIKNAVNAQLEAHGLAQVADGGDIAIVAIKTSQTQRTLIDLYDGKTKQLIWRGSTESVLSDKAEKNEKNLDKGVAKMFKDFPPGSGKR
jgi:Domain of unknown function (DUF4136)